MRFSVGDSVRWKGANDGNTYYNYGVWRIGATAKVVDVRGDGRQLCLRVEQKDVLNTLDEYGKNQRTDGGRECWVDAAFVGDIKNKSEKTVMSSLIEKAKLAFKGEPEKSFIKAGVMEADETLTEEGTELFLTFLLKKHGTEFKAEVIDPILAEEAKK